MAWTRTTDSRYGTQVWVQPGPNGGCYYWTDKWGPYYGALLMDSVWFNVYRGQDFERGPLGAPIRGRLYMSEFKTPTWNSAGYWCEAGGLYSVGPYGFVTYSLGNWGQRSPYP